MWSMFTKNKKAYMAAAGVFLLGLFCITRIWRVMTIPAGLHIDESGMAYSAWCLSQYGVDRDLKEWPVYLVNFGGGQSAMYAYLCALLFRVFGYHIILVRLPGILFSLIGGIFTVLLMRLIAPGSFWKPFLCGVLWVICPYFVLASRFGMDCNLMLGASMAFLYFFVRAIQSGKMGLYFTAGTVGGLVLYTYALSYLILPLFLLLSLLYVLRGRKFSLKGWALMALPMGILAFPLILEQIVNAFDLPEMKLGIFTITKMTTYRASEITMATWENFVKALRSVFVGDEWAYNSIPGTPNLYAITIPLFLAGFGCAAAGILREIRKRETGILSFVLLWFTAVFFFECHVISNVNKINSIFGVTIILAVYGLAALCRVVGKKLGTALLSVVCGIYVLCFLRFGTYYFGGQYTADYYPLPYFDIPVTEAVTFLEENPQYRGLGTYMAEQPELFSLSTFPSPYDLEIWNEDKTFFDYYHCGTLGEVEEGYNYIVRDVFGEYADGLRALGYQENKYVGYSLFYKEWKK